MGWSWIDEVLVSACGRFEIKESRAGRGPPLMLLDRGRWVGDYMTGRGAKAEAERLKTARAA